MGLEKIAEFRKKKGLSIDDLSRKSGVPKGTLSKISAGITKNPNLETLKSIARALECSLDDFDDKIEKAPALAEEPTAEAFELKLYRALVSGGIIPPGGDLTDKQVEILDAIATIIDATFGD